jgi:regulator of protease activity HflC (stomatin/prohibitin superfamily)
MSDWSEEITAAEAAAEQKQAAEREAEGRFDAVHAQAQAAGAVSDALKSPEFHDWMAARHATDAAWGTWSVVMDNKPQG